MRRGALRPAMGIAPELSDAEVVTLAVLQALPGYCSESRWLRHAGQPVRRSLLAYDH